MSISYADKSVASLRSLITLIERELTTGGPPEALRAAFAQLVEVLALGPPPELRECPTCGEVGMRAATRCSRCWSTLTPLAPLPLAAPVPATAHSGG